MLSMVSDPFRLSFLERAEKVYAAQFLFGGNPYDSTFFAYIPRYVKIPTGKGLVLSPIRDRLSFLDMSRKSVRSTIFVWGQPL